MNFLIYVGIFYLGAMVGYCLRAWLQYRTSYNGVVFVTKEEGKTVYSLMLDEYPEKIEFRKELILQVKTPDESPNRD